MPKILGATQVVGNLTATSVNGITGLGSNIGDIQTNGTKSTGTSSYAARVDHAHDGGGTGSTTLSGLMDVDTTTIAPINGDALTFDSTSQKQVPSQLGEDFIQILSTVGTNSTTYTLTSVADSIIVFIDGILQNDYTHTIKTDQLVFGFNVDNESLIEVYKVVKVTATQESIHNFLLMGA